MSEVNFKMRGDDGMKATVEGNASEIAELLGLLKDKARNRGAVCIGPEAQCIGPEVRCISPRMQCMGLERG